MAESAKAKFNRYLKRDFTKAEAKGIIGFMVADKLIDVATFGALNRLTGKALVGTVTKLIPLALRAAAVPAASIARSALPLVTNPYLAGTALGLGALQTQPGQELLEAAAQSGADTRRSLDMALFNIQALGEQKVKRTKSKFNTAVSKGMSIVKGSTSYGRKGVINAPKKAFAAVVKVASAASKKKKAPKTGITRKIYLGVKGLFK